MEVLCSIFQYDVWKLFRIGACLISNDIVPGSSGKYNEDECQSWLKQINTSRTKWQLRELVMPPRTREEAMLIKVRLASPILFVVWQLELPFCAEKKFGRGSVTQLLRQL